MDKIYKFIVNGEERIAHVAPKNEEAFFEKWGKYDPVLQNPIIDTEEEDLIEIDATVGQPPIPPVTESEQTPPVTESEQTPPIQETDLSQKNQEKININNFIQMLSESSLEHAGIFSKESILPELPKYGSKEWNEKKKKFENYQVFLDTEEEEEEEVIVETSDLTPDDYTKKFEHEIKDGELIFYPEGKPDPKPESTWYENAWEGFKQIFLTPEISGGSFDPVKHGGDMFYYHEIDRSDPGKMSPMGSTSFSNLLSIHELPSDRVIFNDKLQKLIQLGDKEGAIESDKLYFTSKTVPPVTTPPKLVAELDYIDKVYTDILNKYKDPNVTEFSVNDLGRVEDNTEIDISQHFKEGKIVKYNYIDGGGRSQSHKDAYTGYMNNGEYFRIEVISRGRGMSQDKNKPAMYVTFGDGKRKYYYGDEDDANYKKALNIFNELEMLSSMQTKLSSEELDFMSTEYKGLKYEDLSPAQKVHIAETKHITEEELGPIGEFDPFYLGDEPIVNEDVKSPTEQEYIEYTNEVTHEALEGFETAVSEFNDNFAIEFDTEMDSLIKKFEPKHKDLILKKFGKEQKEIEANVIKEIKRLEEDLIFKFASLPIEQQSDQKVIDKLNEDFKKEAEYIENYMFEELGQKINLFYSDLVANEPEIIAHQTSSRKEYDKEWERLKKEYVTEWGGRYDKWGIDVLKEIGEELDDSGFAHLNMQEKKQYLNRILDYRLEGMEKFNPAAISNPEDREEYKRQFYAYFYDKLNTRLEDGKEVYTNFFLKSLMQDQIGSLDKHHKPYIRKVQRFNYHGGLAEEDEIVEYAGIKKTYSKWDGGAGDYKVPTTRYEIEGVADYLKDPENNASEISPEIKYILEQVLENGIDRYLPSNHYLLKQHSSRDLKYFTWTNQPKAEDWKSISANEIDLSNPEHIFAIQQEIGKIWDFKVVPLRTKIRRFAKDVLNNPETIRDMGNSEIWAGYSSLELHEYIPLISGLVGWHDNKAIKAVEDKIALHPNKTAKELLAEGVLAPWEEQLLMSHTVLQSHDQMVSKLSSWYNAGKGAAHSTAFMAETILTWPMGVGASKLLTGALRKKLQKNILKTRLVAGATVQNGKLVIKPGGLQGLSTTQVIADKTIETLGVLAHATTQTFLNPQNIAKNTVERMTGEMQWALTSDADGVIDAIDLITWNSEEGRAMGLKKGEGFAEAFARATGVQFTEYLTEQLGLYLAKIPRGMLNKLPKYKGTRLGDAILDHRFFKGSFLAHMMRKTGLRTPARIIDYFKRRIGGIPGWHGFMNEYAEELINFPLSNWIDGKGPVWAGIRKYDENGKDIGFDWDTLKETAGTVMLMQGAFSTVGIGTAALGYGKSLSYEVGDRTFGTEKEATDYFNKLKKDGKLNSKTYLRTNNFNTFDKWAKALESMGLNKDQIKVPSPRSVTKRVAKEAEILGHKNMTPENAKELDNIHNELSDLNKAPVNKKNRDRIDELTKRKNEIIDPIKADLKKQWSLEHYNNTVANVEKLIKQVEEKTGEKIQLVEGENTKDVEAKILAKLGLKRTLSGKIVGTGTGTFKKGVVVSHVGDLSIEEFLRDVTTKHGAYIPANMLPENEGTYLVFNKDEATTSGGENVAAHEFLHFYFDHILKQNPELKIAFGQTFLQYLKKIDPRMVRDSKFRKRLNAYLDSDLATQSEEAMTLFLDALATGSIQYNESMMTKIGNVIRHIAKYFGLDLEFNNGKDVFNFLKEFNASIQRGEFSPELLAALDGKIQIGGEIAALAESIEVHTKERREKALQKRKAEFDELGINVPEKIWTILEEKDIELTNEAWLTIKSIGQLQTQGVSSKIVGGLWSEIITKINKLEGKQTGIKFSLKESTAEIVAKNTDIFNKIKELSEQKGITLKEAFQDPVKGDGFRRELIMNNMAAANKYAKDAYEKGKKKLEGTNFIVAPLEDLQQEFMVELINLANTWNPDMNPNFGAYIQMPKALPIRYGQVLDRVLSDIQTTSLDELQEAGFDVATGTVSGEIAAVEQTGGKFVTKEINLSNESVLKIEETVNKANVELEGLSYKDVKSLIKKGPLNEVLDIISSEFNSNTIEINNKPVTYSLNDLATKIRETTDLSSEVVVTRELISRYPELNKLGDSINEKGQLTKKDGKKQKVVKIPGLRLAIRNKIVEIGKKMKLIDLLPEGQDTDGVATGVANTMFGKFYEEGKRAKMIEGATAAGKPIQAKNENTTNEQFFELFGINKDGTFKPGRQYDGALREFIVQTAQLAANQQIRVDAIAKGIAERIIVPISRGKSKIMFSEAGLNGDAKAVKKINPNLNHPPITESNKKEFGKDLINIYYLFEELIGPGFLNKTIAITSSTIPGREGSKGYKLRKNFKEWFEGQVDLRPVYFYNKKGDYVRANNYDDALEAAREKTGNPKLKRSDIRKNDRFIRTPIDTKLIRKLQAKGRTVLKNEISALNKRNVSNFIDMWMAIHKMVQDNPNLISPLMHWLRGSQNEGSHPNRIGVELLAIDESVKGKLYFEHALQNASAYRALMMFAAEIKDEGHFRSILETLNKQYKLIAISKTDNGKIDAASYTDETGKRISFKNGMGLGWNIFDNNWWERYFNKIVASINNGISIDNLIDIQTGKPLGEILNINNSGGIRNSKPAYKIKSTQNIDKAFTNRIKYSKSGKSKGMSTFDFDDTLARTKSGVQYTMDNPDGSPAPKKKVIFMAGGPGSGKSNVIKQLGLEKQGFKIVNQDISLEWLSKNHGLPTDMRDFTPEQASKWGSLQWEARDIAQRKKMKFQGKGDGVIVDGTGGSVISLMSQVQQFKSKGYDVQMIYVETSLKTALARNKARKERSLKDIIVVNTHKKVTANKEKFKQEFGENFNEVNTDNLKQGDAMPKNLVNKLDKFTKGYIKGRLTAEQFANQGAELESQGAKFDFSEFNYVKDGEPGPYFETAIKRAKKYGTKDMFVLTARPQASAHSIHVFLLYHGLKIPMENITGLANSTGEAKAEWMLEKFAEGYNDMYFVDDAFANVKAVKDVLNQLDIKSKVVQAKIKFSKSANKDFNEMLERKKGIDANKRFSAAEARKRGSQPNIARFLKSLYIPPSAEDFKGLLYYFLGKGKQGDADMKFFADNLLVPFAKGIRAWNTYKQNMVNDYKTLKKQFPDVRKTLNKKVPGTSFTTDTAIRVYLWAKAGFEIPGISKQLQKQLLDHVNKNPNVKSFAEGLSTITKRKNGYVKPSENWMMESIPTDLRHVVDKVGRKEFLEEWINNKNIIFSPENLNKIEALYGTWYRDALENILYRMENGTNRLQGQDKVVNWFTEWINQSVGAIMFFNMRSALLQTISTVNFINWSDNNMFKASAAFANAPQFWKDFAMLFNSDQLKQRRRGLQTDVSASELTKTFAEGGYSPRTVINHLLQIGFTPTQIADSFAIAFGGASFYRNRYNTYIKQGMSKKEAHDKTMLDFQEIAEETQQSSREDLISQQQAGPLGRLILAFQNVTMQYGRLTKKALSDLVNGRGDWKTNVSKIIYYGMVQNIVFAALQSALAMIMWGDDEELIDDKTIRAANQALDSFLRGTGLYGALVSTLKNTAIQWHEQSKKPYGKERVEKIPLELINLSPPIGSKVRKIVNAYYSEKWDKGVSEELGWRIENPKLDMATNIIEALTNIPVNRIQNKANNLEEAITGNHETWKRVFMALGWNYWNLGVEDEEVEEAEKKAKEKKTKEKEKIKEEEKIEKKKKEEKEKKEKGIKTIRCSGTNSSGDRCGLTTETNKKSWKCFHHMKFKEGMDRDGDGIKEYQCKATTGSGRRCKNKTENKSKKCYAHQ